MVGVIAVAAVEGETVFGGQKLSSPHIDQTV